MRTSIAAAPARVWRALTDPSELIAWDPSMIAAIDPISDYPSCERAMRWRYRLGRVPVVLHDRPREIVPLQKLHSTLTMGSLRYEQTYSLALEGAVAAATPVTQLGIKLVASNSVPVLGATIDRFEMRRLAAERVDEMIRALQSWCERPLSAPASAAGDRSRSPSPGGRPSRQTSRSR